jgi:F-type H+-transporting ATPase subunit alpha
MRKIAGTLRITMAQYRALEAFAQFGSELDKASQQQLARGARVVEILKQPQYEPVPVERQVIAIWVGTGGYLDAYPVEDAKRFVDEFTTSLAARTDVLDRIRDTGELSDEAQATLKQAMEDFAQTFAPSEAAAGTEAAAGQGGPRDPVREDVGWDRLSSHDDEDAEGAGESLAEGSEPGGTSPKTPDA